jgi:hypothetical protein
MVVLWLRYVPSKIQGRLQHWRELWNTKANEDKVQSIVLVFLGRIVLS